MPTPAPIELHTPRLTLRWMTEAEALQALLTYGFDTLGLNRVEADIDPRNTGSQRVLEKLGFRQEGYMPERWIVDGVTADTAFYGLLHSDWMARGRRAV